MSLAKVVELLAEGASIEAAVESAVKEAGETVRNIRHVYINDMQAVVEGGRIAKYRVNCKVTFVVDDQHLS
jgi:flavin-binding protein dodecin